MIAISRAAWDVMVAHARAAYPNECCGAMLGTLEGGTKRVAEAVPIENAFEGVQRERYEIAPEDLLRADREARARGLELIGIFHSHPDCDAYFSATDLKNSCPWYSFVVLSVRRGEVVAARSFLPDLDQTRADEEELIYGKDSDTHTASAVRG
ncbi:MAG TPA: M67 family metallopeptidase [Bryobacteraceae bacterium]|nr:M67 family metallopeptidase [Bryobacteraceae bacterium]